MKVGIPGETKADEYRVSMTPAGVRELTDHGHEVVIQEGAGVASGFNDPQYVAQGATIAPDADGVFSTAEMMAAHFMARPTARQNSSHKDRTVSAQQYNLACRAPYLAQSRTKRSCRQPTADQSRRNAQSRRVGAPQD